MGTTLIKPKKSFFLCIILIVLLILFITPKTIWAKSGFEVYFLGVDLKTFQGSHWVKVAAGAVASVLVHELGHALYLESQGKDWSLKASSAGLAVQTSDCLSDKQCRWLGRSGFLLQSGIGVLLTTFEGTRNSDFTKGWVGMNVIQVLSYNWRNHDIGDDFALIDRGHGNGGSELGLFSVMGVHNFLKATLPTNTISYSVKGSRDPQRPLIIKYPQVKLHREMDLLTLPIGTEIVERKSSHSLAGNITGWEYHHFGFDVISITEERSGSTHRGLGLLSDPKLSKI